MKNSYKKAVILVFAISFAFLLSHSHAEESAHGVHVKYFFSSGSYENEKDTETDADKEKTSTSYSGHKVKVFYKGGAESHKAGIGAYLSFVPESDIKSKVGGGDETDLKEKFSRSEATLNAFYKGQHSLSEEFKVQFGVKADLYKYNFGDRGLATSRVIDVFNLSPYGGASSYAALYGGASYKLGPGHLGVKAAFHYNFFQNTELSLHEDGDKKYLSEDEVEEGEIKSAKYEISGGHPVIAKVYYNAHLSEVFHVLPFAYYSLVVLPREAELKVTPKDGAEESKGKSEDIKGSTFALGAKLGYKINDNFKVAGIGIYQFTNNHQYKETEGTGDAATETKFKGSNNGFSVGAKVSYQF